MWGLLESSSSNSSSRSNGEEEVKVLTDCRTFCWAGNPESKELEEGWFDLGRYQRYFKTSVVRSRTLDEEGVGK